MNGTSSGSAISAAFNSSSSGETVQQPKQPQPQPTLQKAGKHKLILSGTTSKSTMAVATATGSNVFTSKRQKQVQAQNNNNAVLVKRIQLNANTSTTTNKASTNNVEKCSLSTSLPPAHDGVHITDNGTSTINPTTRLTDFAYRCLPAAATTMMYHDTSTSNSTSSYHRGRRSNKLLRKGTTTAQLIRVKPGEDPQQVFSLDDKKKAASTLVMPIPTAQSITGSNTGNYKFIRVPTDTATTHQEPFVKRRPTSIQHKKECASTIQICPVVLSGAECNEIHCTKRHDIPRVMATPICTFFQRQGGQCHKGDSCRFMHVKVNPQAEICSVFQTYGHCSAGESCPRKHIRAVHPSLQTWNTNLVGNTTS